MGSRIISNEDTDILDGLKKKDMAADYYDNAVIAKEHRIWFIPWQI